jgi:hypothetical protein
MLRWDSHFRDQGLGGLVIFAQHFGGSGLRLDAYQSLCNWLMLGNNVCHDAIVLKITMAKVQVSSYLIQHFT